MDILFLLAMMCLAAFMILAIYDGLYLHIWKYELFNHTESRFEHRTHTVRAMLFPLILWLLFVESGRPAFQLGLALVLTDLVVLGVDAYSEKDSRRFMGGLPRWEYIIHLFANAFHFAAIVLIVATRLKIEASGLIYSTAFLQRHAFRLIQLIAVNLLPGAILLGLIHLLLASDTGRRLWNKTRPKITCC